MAEHQGDTRNVTIPRAGIPVFKVRGTTSGVVEKKEIISYPANAPIAHSLPSLAEIADKHRVISSSAATSALTTPAIFGPDQACKRRSGPLEVRWPRAPERLYPVKLGQRLSPVPNQ